MESELAEYCIHMNAVSTDKTYSDQLRYEAEVEAERRGTDADTLGERHWDVWDVLETLLTPFSFWEAIELRASLGQSFA